jgi:hypothetical protein
MGWKRALRWAAAVAAALITIGLSPAWRGLSPGGGGSHESLAFAASPALPTPMPQAAGKDRILTLTVWVYGEGRTQWDAMTKDPRDGPGTTVRKSTVTDTAGAFCMGSATYRINEIHEDKDGGWVDLEKIDSICTDLGIRGGGHEAGSRDYTPKYERVGKEWEKNHGSWVYELKTAPDQWRGPDLSFHSSREFEVSVPWLPVSYPARNIKGAGIYESRGRPPREYTRDFATGAAHAIDVALGQAFHTDKEFQSKLRGRVDWSKRFSVTGHATLSQTKQFPIVLFWAGSEGVSGGNGTSQATIDVVWTVSDEPPLVEMDLIPPSDYERWLPRGGKDEKTPGSTFTVKVDIHKLGQPGVAPDAQVTKLMVWLADVSDQPGVCLNSPPPEKATRDYDFRFRATPGWTTKAKGQRAEANPPSPQSTVVLDCYDYGGWTAVMATADLADGRHLVARVKGGTKSTQLIVPKDDNNNHIADDWEKKNVSPNFSTDPASDEDMVPEGAGPGDGLSLYEEYRGFMVRGKYLRTDPSKKDLFIYSSAPGKIDGGVDLFGRTTLITTHKINLDEMAEGQSINFNSVWAFTVSQKAVSILLGTQEEIDASGGQGSFQHPGGYATATKKIMLVRPTDRQSICHELGHAVWIDHHGDGAYDLSLKDCSGDMCAKKTAARAKLQDIADIIGRKLDSIFIAVIHGEHSGEPFCFMHYPWADFIETSAGEFMPYGSREMDQRIFCRDKNGTKCGNAIRGQCLKQITVSDKGKY